MFNKDFYPTPQAVYNTMRPDVKNKVVYDPSAGKGDLLKFAKADGAQRVLASENDEQLLTFLYGAGVDVIGHDFFNITPSDIASVDVILMNPPFSNADHHINHAWEIAPSGATIYALCNAETVLNPFSKSRRMLSFNIEAHGNMVELGAVFMDAERTTNVNVAFITLQKPKVEGMDFSDFFSNEEDDAFGSNEAGLMPFNEIRSIVQAYVGTLKYFQEIYDYADRIKNLNPEITYVNVGVQFSTRDMVEPTFGHVVAKIQKKYWDLVFRKLKVDKYITSSVRDDLNKFIEQQSSVKFTMNNIFTLVDMLHQTKDQVFDKALEAAVDNYTMYTHENRYAVDGWKTNSGYMLNKKFIIGYFATPSYIRGMRVSPYGRSYDMFQDLIKVLCNITGKSYGNILDINLAPATVNSEGLYLTDRGEWVNIDKVPYSSRILNSEAFVPGKWYDWEFFEIKLYKKGTAHIKFRDDTVWEMLNRRYAKIKGQVLPEKL